MSAQIPVISLPTYMNTRAGNKNKHPGIVDLPQSQRRDPEQVARTRQEAKEAAMQRTKNMSLIAGLEDTYVREDEQREAARIADRAIAAEARKAQPAPAKKGVLLTICMPSAMNLRFGFSIKSNTCHDN